MNNFAGKDYFLCQMFDQLASFYYLAGVGLESAGGVLCEQELHDVEF